ncbi:aldehyde dehydrogenase (NADP(+)) [Novosphingobium sp. PASSN1]|uniref:aldehyde dehydrogenase (NADP(+)) n=1 Tax=Novosphingobium sp. PASSN1 TaxID=2015561 RepID=UPI000BD8FA55|nr:aldehyde dehydrogenase (NADP(+)) [Novosphingobium sp. PASSN1]OYU33865.1 MAG: aldehyde dehydrogenase (NADP(+)) [Novosphingobium sp. PASSN1]
MTFDGSILIGARDVRRDTVFRALEAGSGAELPQPFCEATAEDVAAACALAEGASGAFGALPPAKRAAFLDAVALAIEAIGDILIETAMCETGLPRARLEGERGRTTGQLRMFAAEVREGRWLDAVIDTALPERSPPRADLRRMNVALGPVAVFGASNFPLAFSVAGGDTAAAFAAGCPVVVKGHPAHPGTGELVARAIRSAVQGCGLPEGVFSYMPGRTNALGAALVAHPSIKAVGFTGSRSGGLALVEIARQRAEPIPVYAEMSSINPVALMPAALSARAEALGAGFAASLSLGAGQFCTNPGLVIALDGPDLDRFVAAASAALTAAPPQVMLTPGIRAAYEAGVAALDQNAAARRVGPGALFETTAAQFMADTALGAEVFGVASLVVRCADLGEVAHVIRNLEGQLTATLQIDPDDSTAAAPILALLQARAGRVLANGWPTGVEVTHAMVHGGPFPATSDGRTTSVGTLAITRFLRPVCYQDMPDALLPPALQAANPWRIPRRVNGIQGEA